MFTTTENGFTVVRFGKLKTFLVMMFGERVQAKDSGYQVTAYFFRGELYVMEVERINLECRP